MCNPDEAKNVKGMVVELPCFTDNVRLMTKAAYEAHEHVYREG